MFSKKWIIIQLWDLYTIAISMPENCRVHWVWPSKYKGKWCYSPKCVFSENRSSYSFETCTIGISMPENCRVQWVLPSKYKGKWHYSPKCIFSKWIIQIWNLYHWDLACLKTSGCTDFDPLNTKKRDVIDQNVFSQKWIIIQLWNLHHWDQHAWNLRVCWLWPSKYKGKWCYSPKCVF